MSFGNYVGIFYSWSKQKLVPSEYKHESFATVFFLLGFGKLSRNIGQKRWAFKFRGNLSLDPLWLEDIRNFGEKSAELQIWKKNASW